MERGSANFEIRHVGPGRFALAGELGFRTITDAMEKTVGLVAESSEIVFDLSGLSRADSAGLALILDWQRRALEAGAVIRFVHPTPQLTAIAHVAGVESIIFKPEPVVSDAGPC